MPGSSKSDSSERKRSSKSKDIEETAKVAKSGHKGGELTIKMANEPTKKLASGGAQVDDAPQIDRVVSAMETQGKLFANMVETMGVFMKGVEKNMTPSLPTLPPGSISESEWSVFDKIVPTYFIGSGSTVGNVVDPFPVRNLEDDEVEEIEDEDEDPPSDSLLEQFGAGKAM